MGIREAAAKAIFVSLGVHAFRRVAGKPREWQELELKARRTQVGGQKIVWAACGKGKPLVLLGAAGSPMAEWDPVLLTLLARNRRVVIIDYPGCGGSPAMKANWTIKNSAGLIAQFIEAAGLGPTDVLGWSMGGAIAQEIAANHPGSIKDLILVAASPGGRKPGKKTDLENSKDSEVEQYLAANYPSSKAGIAGGRGYISRLVEVTKKPSWPKGGVSPEVFTQMIQAEEKWNRSRTNLSRIENIKARTLIIYGKEDTVTPPSEGELLAAKIPNSRAVALEDTGHCLLYQEGEKAATLIEAFLQE